jgi:hypothetical protein
MELHLEEEEASLLFRVVRNRFDELRSQVRHDKNSETRAYLKHKESILNRILAKFPELDEKAHMRGYLGNLK